ncbi:MAG: hypothetical protein LUD00_03165 [Prevotellaceae bacterium]|nr:hypothetical protein [Prevotellaceae bacterium]
MLFLSVFYACDNDEDNNSETMSVTLWRDDSCVVTLPSGFGDDVILKYDREMCDVTVQENKIIILTKERLGTSEIVVGESGKVRIETSVVIPSGIYGGIASRYSILPALDENTDESLSVNRYITQNMAAYLEFDGDSIKGLNENEEVVYSGRYEYHRGRLTIHRRDGSVVSLKVLSGDRINLQLEEDITDIVKTLFPDAPADEYKLLRYLRNNV